MKPHYTAAEVAAQIAFEALWKEPVGTEVEEVGPISCKTNESLTTPRTVWFDRKGVVVNDPSFEKRKAAL